MCIASVPKRKPRWPSPDNTGLQYLLFPGQSPQEETFLLRGYLRLTFESQISIWIVFKLFWQPFNVGSTYYSEMTCLRICQPFLGTIRHWNARSSLMNPQELYLWWVKYWWVFLGYVFPLVAFKTWQSISQQAWKVVTVWWAWDRSKKVLFGEQFSHQASMKISTKTSTYLCTNPWKFLNHLEPTINPFKEQRTQTGGIQL